MKAHITKGSSEDLWQWCQLEESLNGFCWLGHFMPRSPELVNWNFLILKQFFHKIFLKTLTFWFSVCFFFWLFSLIIVVFLCLQKNYSSFCSLRDTAKCHSKFVEFGGKLKQCTIFGSSSLLLPKNNTQSWHWTSFAVECKSLTEFVEIDNYTDCSFILNQNIDFLTTNLLWSLEVSHKTVM